MERTSWASLRCNLAACRKSLAREDKAVVTNCMHIFCLDCANVQASLIHGHPYPVCPSCGTQLPEREDLVCTSLNPSPDYKSSVLSGLPPSVILDIAGQALNFWAYQQSLESHSQNLALQEAQERSKTLQKEYRALETQSREEVKILVQQLKRAERALRRSKAVANDNNVPGGVAPRNSKSGQPGLENSGKSYPHPTAPHNKRPLGASPTGRLVQPQTTQTSRRLVPHLEVLEKSLGKSEGLNTLGGSRDSSTSGKSSRPAQFRGPIKLGGASKSNPESDCMGPPEPSKKRLGVEAKHNVGLRHRATSPNVQQSHSTTTRLLNPRPRREETASGQVLQKTFSLKPFLQAHTPQRFSAAQSKAGWG